MKLGRNRFLPDLEVVPTHDTPTFIAVDLTADKIEHTLAQLFSMATTGALGVGEANPTEVEINGREFRINGDSIERWFLFESVDDGNTEDQDKMFVLVPQSSYDLTQYNNMLPSVRIEDPDFDEKYESPSMARMMRWYILGVLIKLLRD